MSNTNLEIANTILNQLGGRKFITMTGSHSFTAGANFLTMKLRRNLLNAQYLKIELTSMDDYTMKFVSFNSKTGDMVEKAVVEGVYCDMLQSIFTEKTGLYTSL